MKIIKYELYQYTDEKGNVVTLPKRIECETQAIYDANYSIAEKEAVPDTIEISGEFDFEPVVEPTSDELLNALLGVTSNE